MRSIFESTLFKIFLWSCNHNHTLRYRHFDTYNLYQNYCLAYASIIFIQSENMSRGIKLQFISIMKICINSDTRYQLFIIFEIQSKIEIIFWARRQNLMHTKEVIDNKTIFQKIHSRFIWVQFPFILCV